MQCVYGQQRIGTTLLPFVYPSVVNLRAIRQLWFQCRPAVGEKENEALDRIRLILGLHQLTG